MYSCRKQTRGILGGGGAQGHQRTCRSIQERKGYPVDLCHLLCHHQLPELQGKKTFQPFRVTDPPPTPSEETP